MRKASSETGVLLYAFTCGYITLPTTYFIAGGEGKTKVPACTFLIDHPAGYALFDTGFSASICFAIALISACAAATVTPGLSRPYAWYWWM